MAQQIWRTSFGLDASVFIDGSVRDYTKSVKIGYTGNMIDVYSKFDDLSAHMTEGKDYRIVTEKRNSPYVIMAMHGGSIEPFTSEIATAIAGEEYALYVFEGIRERRNLELHIASEYFDEPQAKDMVRVADVVVSIHGQHDTENESVMVGGLNKGLAEKIRARLTEVDMPIRPFDARFVPDSPQNICNQGMSGGGVEIVISRKLRDSLRDDTGLYRLFINAIRHAIAAHQSE